MSGILGVLLSAGSDIVVVVVTDNGNTQITGVATPSEVRGVTLDNLQSTTSSLDFRLGMSSVVAQGFFKYIIVQGSDGAYSTLTSASATFSNPLGTRSQWDWSGDGLWTTSHASRTVQFQF